MGLITIYGHSDCIWCRRALTLCVENSVPYDYRDVRKDPDSRAFILDKGFTTVPQIYRFGYHIGGYEDLEAQLGNAGR